MVGRLCTCPVDGSGGKSVNSFKFQRIWTNVIDGVANESDRAGLSEPVGGAGKGRSRDVSRLRLGGGLQSASRMRWPIPHFSWARDCLLRGRRGREAEVFKEVSQIAGKRERRRRTLINI